MATCFDSFFAKYKGLLREYERYRKNLKRKQLNWTVIITTGIVLLLSLTLLLLRVNDILCSCISLAIMFCCIILLANIEPYPSSEPDANPYYKHMCNVIALLKDNGINITDTDKIKTMIDYANALIARRDPLVDVRRALAVTGSAGAVIITALSGALKGTINLFDSIPYIIVVIWLVFVAVVFFSPVLSFIAEQVFPNKKRLNNLIVDLNQILMFDINSVMKEDRYDIRKKMETKK